MLKNTLLFLVFMLALILIGCSTKEKIELTETEATSKMVQDEKLEEKEISRYDGAPSGVIDRAYTTEGKMALTINGLNNEEVMEEILEKLSEKKWQASFFVTDDELKNEQEMIQKIASEGHHIEIKVSDDYSIEEMEYEEIYTLLFEMKNSLLEQVDKDKIYVRKNSIKEQKDLELIVAQLELGPIIGHSIRPTEKSLEDEELFSQNFRRAFQRGGIISLDAKDYPQIIDGLHILEEELQFLKYDVIPLVDLIVLDEGRKPFEDIEGHDLLEVNLDYENETPNVFYKQHIDEKIVALTFDDYGSDRTVNQILDILDEHDIQSTFFLKGSQVERNPNLAKVILDRGHEIANHSYSHNRSTELDREELQKDLIEAHKVITEAIQEKPTMLFRPPFGNIDDETAKVIAAVGFNDIAMYDISSYDWNLEYTVDDVVHRVMSNVEPGSVIVLHMNDDIHNLDALPIIIERLKEVGYRFTKMGKWFEE